MKNVCLIMVSVIILVMCLFVAPSILNAEHIGPIEFSGNGHYYELLEDLSWEDARDEALSLGGYLATITSDSEAEFILDKFGHIYNIWLGGYQPSGTEEPDSGWQWVSGEPWGSFTNWNTDEPNDSGGEDVLELVWGDKWNDSSGDAEFHFIVEYEPTAPYVEPVWVRDSEMKCKQVWINEDNKFQFSFIYPYADNNWVKIYDMNGKLVYEVDMPLDNPNIIVDLPDGMYTVKTFHDQPEPLQTFIIGKP